MFGRKRQLVDILYTTDVLGFDTHAVHLLLVEGYFFITALHLLAESFTLESRHLVAAHTFHFGIVYHKLEV